MIGFNNCKIRRACLRSAKEVRDLQRPATIVKQGSLRPFKRANELFQKVTDIYAQFSSQPHLVQEKLHELTPYESRGHGWKGRIKNRTITGRWNQDRSKWMPHQGDKERGKRVLTTLTPDQRAVAIQLGNELMAETGRPVKPHRSGGGERVGDL